MYLAPESWLFFRYGANECAAVIYLNHGYGFLRLYVNDYNCSKSCLGTCFLISVAYTATVCLTQRYSARNPFSSTNLGSMLSWDVPCGRRILVKLLQPCTVLKYSFYLLSSWLKSIYCPAKTSEGGVLFLPPSDVHVRGFPILSL